MHIMVVLYGLAGQKTHGHGELSPFHERGEKVESRSVRAIEDVCETGQTGAEGRECRRG